MASQYIRLFVQQLAQAEFKDTTRICITGPLWGEATGKFPPQRASCPESVVRFISFNGKIIAYYLRNLHTSSTYSVPLLAHDGAKPSTSAANPWMFFFFKCSYKHISSLIGRERELLNLPFFLGQRGPCNPYKQCNHNLYIGIIIFPHIDNTHSTGYS